MVFHGLGSIRLTFLCWSLIRAIKRRNSPNILRLLCCSAPVSADDCDCTGPVSTTRTHGAGSHGFTNDTLRMQMTPGNKKQQPRHLRSHVKRTPTTSHAEPLKVKRLLQKLNVHVQLSWTNRGRCNGCCFRPNPNIDVRIRGLLSLFSALDHERLLWCVWTEARLPGNHQFMSKQIFRAAEWLPGRKCNSVYFPSMFHVSVGVLTERELRGIFTTNPVSLESVDELRHTDVD